MLRTHGHAPLRAARLDPHGVGAGRALPSPEPAKMRGRQAVPLRRHGSRRIGGKRAFFVDSKITLRYKKVYLCIKCINIRFGWQVGV